MAGTEFYLVLRNSNKEKIKECIIGNMRYYPSMFSLESICTRRDADYNLEHRLSNGKQNYYIFDENTMRTIRSFKNEDTLTEEEEEEALYDSKMALRFAEENKIENCHFVFEAHHDY